MARQKSSSSRKRTAAAAAAAGGASAAAASGSTTTSKLLDDLAHYKVLKKEDGTSSAAAATVKQETAATMEQKVDPLESIARRIPSMNQRALDGSELDSGDEDPQTLDATWNGNDDNSDAESVDSELDNPLKHAGKYSAEEVVRMMREKLIRLQKLYIDQFQRLRYLLKEEGRKYKQNVLMEKEAELSSIHAQIKTSLEDITTYEKIKALNHYQRPQGLEAVLHHAFLERRFKLGEQGSTSGGAGGGSSAAGGGWSSGSLGGGGGQAHFKPTVLPKCSYHLSSSTKCGDPVIPLSKFCIKHVLEDSGQVLFRSCGHVATSGDSGCNGDDDGEEVDPAKDGPCETPIADVLEGATCVFHAQFNGPFTAHEDNKPDAANKAKGAAPAVPNPEAADVDVTETDDAVKQEPV